MSVHVCLYTLKLEFVTAACFLRYIMKLLTKGKHEKKRFLKKYINQLLILSIKWLKIVKKMPVMISYRQSRDIHMSCFDIQCPSSNNRVLSDLSKLMKQKKELYKVKTIQSIT